MSAISEEKAENVVTNAMKDTSKDAIVMKQDLVDTLVQSPVPSQNGTNGKDSASINTAKPVKTQGEASSHENNFIPRSLQLTPTSNAPSSSPITPFAPNLGSLSLQLTQDEQTAAYKKANILALSALAKKGGPNAKDMFAVQQKLQEFLTSLITLAGQKGPQLKVTVQMLVQNLVTGQLTEEEFASRIESDLHSQHQPSLLPFLKNSVPHLKTRLQLQQAIMKELLQRVIAEKKTSIPSPSTTTTPSSSSLSSTGPTPNTTISIVNSTSSSVPPPTPPQTKSSVGVPLLPPNPPSVVTINSGGGGMAAKPVIIGGGTGITGLVPSNMTPIPGQFDLETLSRQLPKDLRDQISKLPQEQQVFVYMHHFRKLQLLKQHSKQQQQQQGAGSKVTTGQQQIRNSPIPNSMGSGTNEMKGKSSFSMMKLIPGHQGGGGGGSGVVAVSLPTLPSSSSTGGKKKGKKKDTSGGDDEEDDEGMDILDEVGVNLQEETARFLPQAVGGDSGVSRSYKDVVFLNLSNLQQKIDGILKMNGLKEVSEDILVYLSHATQERMRDVVEKLTEISHHRMEVLKDDRNYKVQSEVRSQLRVLETIDRIVHKRKQEREHEQTLRAAKSRSKGADPEKAAKIREEAKQIQQDEATRIRNESANRTALAAIGRKRPLPPSTADDSGGDRSEPQLGSSEGGGTNVMTTSSLFAPLASTRSPKRHVTSRDLLFYMEQERETRKSLALYKTFLK